MHYIYYDSSTSDMSDIIDLPLPLPFLSGTHVPVLQVVAGDHNLTDDKGDFYAVSSILVHPEFDSSSKDYDVAILTLRDPITFSATVAPICLPSLPQTCVGPICVPAGLELLTDLHEVSQIQFHVWHSVFLVLIESACSCFQQGEYWWAFSGHCGTSRRFVDSTTLYSNHDIMIMRS